MATQLPSPRPPFPQTPSTTVGEPTLWRPWDEAEDGPGRRATPVPTIEVLATTQRYLRQLRPAAVKRPCSLKVFPEINSTGCGRFLSTRLGPADSGSQRRTARPLPDRNRLSRTQRKTGARKTRNSTQFFLASHYLASRLVGRISASDGLPQALSLRTRFELEEVWERQLVRLVAKLADIKEQESHEVITILEDTIFACMLTCISRVEPRIYGRSYLSEE